LALADVGVVLASTASWRIQTEATEDWKQTTIALDLITVEPIQLVVAQLALRFSFLGAVKQYSKVA
jgi:hypothetical protein